MLNAATPAPTDPLLAVVAPGSAAPGADAAPGFAQALDQAAALQRTATPGDGAAPTTAELASALAGREAPPHARVDSAAGQRSRMAHGDELVRALAVAGSAAHAEAAAADPLAAPASADDDEAPATPAGADAPPPAELLAWVASLPLPPPAPAHPAAPCAERTDTDTATATVAAAAPPNLPDPTDPVARRAAAAATSATPDAAVPRRGDAGAASMPTTAPPPLRGTRGDAGSDARGAAPALAAVAHEPASVRNGGDAATAPPPLPLVAPSLPPQPVQASAALQGEVRADIGTKEFAPALASQLAVLVRDGVEHAQLKLNPAEIKPIEIRISVDGSQTQIDFSAAHAPTRQALQDAVPALASALRDSGLTLAGGGVFEQPRDARGEARPDAPRGTGGRNEPTADTASTTTASTRPLRARGVVDLYA